MADDMVPVPRELVEGVLRGSFLLQEHADALRACLPYEPPAEHVEALMRGLGWFDEEYNRRTIAQALRKAHADGWELRRIEEGDR